MRLRYLWLLFFFLAINSVPAEAGLIKFCRVVSARAWSWLTEDSLELALQKGALGEHLWQDTELGMEEANDLYRRVRLLTTIQQKQLLSQLTEKKPTPGTLEPLLRLALYDEKEWRQLLDGLSNAGLEHPTFLLSLLPLIDEMPPYLKGRLLQRVGERFRDLPKKTGVPFPPKQSMALFIRAALPADKIIAQHIKNGETPLRAFELYYNELQEKVFGKTNPGYEFGDILAAVRATKSALQEVTPNIGGLRAMRGHRVRVTLLGSIINGSGKIDSDLDIITPHEIVTEAVLPRLNQRLSAHWKQRQIPGAEPLVNEIMPEMKALSENFREVTSVVNAIQIEVTDKEVTLLVYDRNVQTPDKRDEMFRQVGAFTGPQYRMDSRPTRYKLE